ncbi:glycoside hydrolase family 127 protein [Longitalea luteola]|uniref:glycoside hydrolase family 127 protein n=1 Tax=Longitalea luteola TaxID=2812563 RepID=UPI001A97739A|nr:beta-L-arabinofuranosidase domain-containing protein [Longitalea luteola]
MIYLARLVMGIAAGTMLMVMELSAQDSLYRNTFPLADVQLLSGLFRQARDLNIKTLLQYDVDRLLAPYRKQAGLSPKAKSYSNWEGLDGHMGGHYLSALAIHYAATGNAECKRRMEYMIAELKTCQDSNAVNNGGWGTGYAGGVPNSQAIWSSLKNGNFSAYRAAWVPWYNVHKMYAGLRDAWLYTGNQQAKTIFLQFCDWGINIVAALSASQLQSVLDTEHGGMNEIFADAYQMTGDPRYMDAARRFSHRQLLEPLSAGKDNLDNKHANTQVPKAVGFQRVAECTQDAQYARAASFFWETVTSNRSVAFGGNSRREFFPGKAACTDFVNDVEGPESCNSNNMLKLTEDLFRVKPLARYMDYYERTLYNHILSTQHPVHGGYVYFTPIRPRHYRVYSAPNEAMWCCVGTGMENHGQYNRLIYTHAQDSLFLNLFVASELNWRSKGFVIRQETRFPDEEYTNLEITRGTGNFTLMVRYPAWVKEQALKIWVNGRPVPYNATPSAYIAIKRNWKKGDKIRVHLPMHNRIEHLPNVPAYVAFMHGPVLLGARTGTEDLSGLVANDGRWAHIAAGRRLPIDKAPIIVEDDPGKITAGLARVPGKPLTFTFPSLRMINSVNIVLEPFYRIHDARYMIYWMALSSKQYQGYLDSLAAVEDQRLSLQRRTVDYVAPGEQQPEADHAMQQEQSRSGTSMNEFWREANDGGHFSYRMATNGETGLSLLVRYWGAEWGNRKFDIYIDDSKLVSENNTGRWNQSAFFDITYAIPDTMIRGKDHIRVKFQSQQGTSAGPVYYLRLVRK